MDEARLTSLFYGEGVITAISTGDQPEKLGVWGMPQTTEVCVSN